MIGNTGLPLGPQPPSHALFQQRGWENIISKATRREGHNGGLSEEEEEEEGGERGTRAGINRNESSSIPLGEGPYCSSYV